MNAPTSRQTASRACRTEHLLFSFSFFFLFFFFFSAFSVFRQLPPFPVARAGFMPRPRLGQLHPAHTAVHSLLLSRPDTHITPIIIIVVQLCAYVPASGSNPWPKI
ncbi:hypothetical protein MN608_07351 [Microdochium nivale]|nr:hypothetical protein MN608_07351 [Microdochium nivale]